MNKKLLIKLPSRSRPIKLFSVLDQITSLSRSNDYHVLLTLDLDDPTSTNDAFKQRLSKYKHVTPVWATSESKTDACNRDMWMAEGWEWKVAILISDDFEIVQEGFDVRIFSDMRANYPDTDGMLWYNDGTPNGHQIITLPIVGRKFYERTNRFYNSSYKSAYCDNEMTRYVKSLDRVKYYPETLCIHKHWLFGQATADELNKKNDNLAVWEHDRNIFLKRNPTLFINYATRGRPVKFLAAMENIQNTISTEYYRILVKADIDDTTMNNEEIRQKVASLKNASIIYIEPTTKVGAINHGMEFAGDWSWMVVMSDDMRFVQKGWDEKMLHDIQDEWSDSLDWFAHFNDGYVGDKLPTMAIMGRDYYKRDNFVYHPSYGSVSCDAEQMFVAIMRGRHKYFPNVYYRHIHPANVPGMIVDDTYRRNDKWGLQDTENYFTRKKDLFYVENPLTIPFDPNLRQ